MPRRTDGPGADPDARARPDGRPWRPETEAGARPPESLAEGSGRPPGSHDELRRRLADLPASHPSSPRYRSGQPDAPPGRSGREGRSPEPAAAKPGEPRAGRSGTSGGNDPGTSGSVRSEQSRVNRAGRPGEGRDEPAAGTPGGERRGPGARDDAEQGGRAPGRRESAGGAAAVAARLIRGGQPRTPEQDAKDRRADDALWARAAAQHAAAQARRRSRGSPAPSYPPARREPFRPWFTTSADEDLWLNAERTGDPWFADGDGKSER
jgi:hypothetical protein